MHKNIFKYNAKSTKAGIMTGILFCSYIGGTLLCEANSSNSEAMPSYILEDIVVTATRTETKDLDTPATTVVITRKQLEEQGENSLFEAISKVVGITAWSFGTGGGDYVGNPIRLNIRGIDKGTLILLNGVPINLEAQIR